jgi:hypothetical protein
VNVIKNPGMKARILFVLFLGLLVYGLQTTPIAKLLKLKLTLHHLLVLVSGVV